MSLLRWNFKRLLWFQTLFFFVSGGLFLTWLLYSLNGYLQQASIHNLQKVVVTPYEIMNHYHQKELRGQITAKEAQDRAKEEIRDLRWGSDGKNYFWINSDDPNHITIIMHPYKPQIEGKDVTNFQDKKGNRLFYEMTQVCNSSPKKGGFVRYYWQYKDDKSRIEPKVSFVKLFEPWGWIVGTGAYETDLNGESWAMIKDFVTLTIFIAVLLGGFFLALSLFITGKLTSAMKHLVARMKELASGEADLTKLMNTKTINCSKVINCSKDDCPCYGKEAHCWYEAGSYATEPVCPLITSGEYKSCDECKVYKMTINLETDEISNYINAFMSRIRTLIQKAKNQGQIVRNESESMNSVADKMAGATAKASQHSEEIRNMAENSGEGISSVAAAMEEMSSTITEVSQNTSRASQVANEASHEADRARAVIENLAESATKINEISNLIGSIAEQTNLLALNATIEAARAGEAGKGFAVVANEVKELAKQTGDSVEEIDNMVKELQSGAKQAQNAVEQSIKVIHEVAELSSNIAAAVEEETAATNEISENTHAVREEIAQMAEKSSEIVSSSMETTTGSKKVKDTASRLKNLSDELMNMLDQFKV